MRSQHKNEVEVRTDTITSLLHCATQRSLRSYSLYFAVRSLTQCVPKAYFLSVIMILQSYHALYSKLHSLTRSKPSMSFDFHLASKGPCKRTQQVTTLLRVVGGFWPTMLRPFAYATNTNIVVVPCKRTQHVGPNNVACCWPTMLRPFAWDLLNTNFWIMCSAPCKRTQHVGAISPNIVEIVLADVGFRQGVETITTCWAR